MSKAILIIFCLLISYQCFAQRNAGNHYHITINTAKLRPSAKKIFIGFLKVNGPDEVRITDSAIVKNGKAIFSGTINEPLAATLQTDKFDTAQNFCLSNNIIVINIGNSINDLTITGSPYQKDFAGLEAAEHVYQVQLTKFDQAYIKAMRAKEGAEAKKLVDEANAIRKAMEEDVYARYIRSNAKTSALSVYALSRLQFQDVKTLQIYYSMLAPAFKKMPTAVALKKQIEDIVSLSAGQLAPNFSQPDTIGNIVSLSSFKGKYVLLDFWASWCHPCREESPYLIKAFNRFHSKKFTILSVSLDDKSAKKAWLDAISKDRVNQWTQVSDLKGWKSSVTTLYNIQTIPRNYLLDPEGRIIAKDLRGDDLGKKLEEIFK